MSLRKINLTIVSESTEETIAVYLQPVDLPEGVTDVRVIVTEEFLQQMSARIEMEANNLLKKYIRKIRKLSEQSGTADQVKAYLEQLQSDLSLPIPKELNDDLQTALSRLIVFYVSLIGDHSDIIKGSITRSGNGFVVNLCVWDKRIELLSAKATPIYPEGMREEPPFALLAILASMEDKIRATNKNFCDLFGEVARTEDKPKDECVDDYKSKDSVVSASQSFVDMFNKK